MPNQWIDFIKDYAKKNNLSYSCAMSQPAAKQEYQEKYKNKTESEKKAAPSKSSKNMIFMIFIINK